VSEVSRLRALLRYEPETGDIFWRVDRANKKAGDRAGRFDKNGYVAVGVDYKKHYVHRIGIAFATGCFPPKGSVIDHLNGNPSDNRIVNLKVVSHQRNILRRTKLNSNNSSGTRGVSWDKRRGKYTAKIMLHGRGIILGRFSSIEDAIACREAENARNGI
jgi:hypothetical protein